MKTKRKLITGIVVIAIILLGILACLLYLNHTAFNTFEKYNDGYTKWYCSTDGITIIYDEKITAFTDKDPQKIYVVSSEGGVSKNWYFKLEDEKNTTNDNPVISGKYKMIDENSFVLSVYKSSNQGIANAGEELTFKRIKE